MEDWLSADQFPELKDKLSSIPPPVPSSIQAKRDKTFNVNLGIKKKSKISKENRVDKQKIANEIVKLSKAFKISALLGLGTILLLSIDTFQALNYKSKFKVLSTTSYKGNEYIRNLKTRITKNVTEREFYIYSDSSVIFKPDTIPSYELIVDLESGETKERVQDGWVSKSSIDISKEYWNERNFHHFKYQSYLEAKRDTVLLNEWINRLNHDLVVGQNELERVKYKIEQLKSKDSRIEKKGNWNYHEDILNELSRPSENDWIISGLVIFTSFIVLSVGRYFIVGGKKMFTWVDSNSSDKPI